MPTYGYARVWTIDQDVSLQRRRLKAAGCDVIRAEKASGTRRSGRTELQVGVVAKSSRKSTLSRLHKTVAG